MFRTTVLRDYAYLNLYVGIFLKWRTISIIMLAFTVLRTYRYQLLHSKIVQEPQDCIHHCLECQLNRTTRHRPYESLNPIESPPVPFYTISIDFIVELLMTRYDVGEYDACLTITDKFTKRVLLVPGKITWSAAQWAVTLLTWRVLVPRSFPFIIP